MPAFLQARASACGVSVFDRRVGELAFKCRVRSDDPCLHAWAVMSPAAPGNIALQVVGYEADDAFYGKSEGAGLSW